MILSSACLMYGNVFPHGSGNITNNSLLQSIILQQQHRPTRSPFVFKYLLTHLIT